MTYTDARQPARQRPGRAPHARMLRHRRRRSSRRARDLPPFVGRGRRRHARLLRHVRGAASCTARPGATRTTTRGADVVVLSRALSEKLFGDGQSGRQAHAHRRAATSSIVGVLPTTGSRCRASTASSTAPAAFGGEDEVFIPFDDRDRHEIGPQRQHELQRRQPSAGWQGLLESECIWIQFWFELAVGRRPPRACKDFLDRLRRRAAQAGPLRRAATNAAVQRHGVAGVPQGGRATTAGCRPGWRSASCWCAWSTPSACCWPSSRRAPARVGVRRALGASRRDDLPAVPDRGRR